MEETPELTIDGANQAPPLENYNSFTADVPLVEAVRRENAEWAEADLVEFGAQMGRAETIRLGETANRNPPVLHTHDRFGERIDEVEFHPAWHELLQIGVSGRHHSLPWAEPRVGGHVARAAFNMLRHQIDEGASCPLTMTFAAVPSLRLQPDVAEDWVPRILSTTYDQRAIPAEHKRGVLLGMAMTERQGGSDLRTNALGADSAGKPGPGCEYFLTGDKWFCSAPMSDAFLVLAQTVNGLSCFLAPRWKPDETRNGIFFRRLKDKLGNRSNASGEAEFRFAWARMIGEEGRGLSVIMEMVRHTRLDCAFGSAATMRRAVAEAVHHCSHRIAFGRRLADQPLMANVLADMCLESEAATAMALRLARGFDDSTIDPIQARFTRLATAIGKYWITKRAIGVTAEAMECLGGNGYVEESPMPRLYRDVPLNSIWEGSGNVQCLDVLRSIKRDRTSLDIYFDEVKQAAGGHIFFDLFIESLERELTWGILEERNARRITGSLALALQAAILIQHAPNFVADAFCNSRLGQNHQAVTGNLSAATRFAEIIERARPVK
ncbi:MAG: acyl-CoA dehydrogenase family protein [Pyrinomonadaceae bacterium]